MGLILDTSALIDAEHARKNVTTMLRALRDRFGDQLVGISSVSVTEFSYGIYRARDQATAARRRAFAEDAFRLLTIYPFDFKVAELAGRIDGELSHPGRRVPFQDLMIAATAMNVDFSVVTTNIRDFQKVPGLTIHNVA